MSSTIYRLDENIERSTRVLGIFTDVESVLTVTCSLMESKDYVPNIIARGPWRYLYNGQYFVHEDGKIPTIDWSTRRRISFSKEGTDLIIIRTETNPSLQDILGKQYGDAVV